MVTDRSAKSNQVRKRFGRIAVLNVATAVLLLAVAIANALSGFIGHGWFFTVMPLVLAVGCLRSASHLWKVRDRVAAGQARVVAMDEPARRAKKRRAYRIMSLQFAVMGAIWITGAIVGGLVGFFIALLAVLIALELIELVARLLLRRRSAAQSNE